MININNLKLTEGQVLIQVDEAFSVLERKQDTVKPSEDEINKLRAGQLHRHGKVILMSKDTEELASTKGNKFTYLHKNPVVIFDIRYAQHFDINITKTDENDKEKSLGFCVVINPGNIISWLEE